MTKIGEYYETVVQPTTVQANNGAKEAREQCLHRIQVTLGAIAEVRIVVVGSRALNVDFAANGDVDICAILHVGKEAFYEVVCTRLEAVGFKVKPILGARCPVYRLIDMSTGVKLEMQFCFTTIDKVPTVADLEDEDFEVDLSHKIYLQPDKIVATEAACHSLRLIKMIKGLPTSDQTLFNQCVIMSKALMSANGLLGNIYGHMPPAAIPVLVAYALMTKHVPTTGGLNACFPALLRWIADTMEGPIRDGWGAVISLPGRAITSYELAVYKHNAMLPTYGRPEPLLVAAMTWPLRNLTRNLHSFHLQHVAEVLRGHGVQLQEGRKVEEVMRGFTAPYLESVTAIPGYTHSFLTVVGTLMEDIGDEELETVYEVAALKMLPMAQKLAACADIMGYYLFPSPIMIAHGPGEHDLSEALDQPPRAYRGFLHAVCVRDLDLDGKHGMDSVPTAVEEAFTAVCGAIIGTLRGGGPGGKSFPKHERKHVYAHTYLLGTGDDGGHVFSTETRLKTVYPNASGKRKREESGVARDQAAGGEVKEAAPDEREDRKKARNKRKNAKRKAKRQQGGGGGGGGGMTEATEQEGQQEEEEEEEEEELIEGEGGMKGADQPEPTEGK